MVDIYQFKKRVARKKREAIKEKGFIVRDCREKFLQVDHEYLNGYARICGLAANSVYFVLCRHVGEEQVCWPATPYIAEKLQISEPTVRKAIKILEAHRIIKVDRIQGQPNIYTLTSKRVWRKTIPNVSDETLEQVKFLGELTVEQKCSQCKMHRPSEGDCVTCRNGESWVYKEG